MSGDDDRERPRRSWREIDRVRDGAHSSGERRPGGPAAEARAAEASKQYRKHLDTMFSKDAGGGEGARLAQEMRDAHGTPRLAEACRAYRDAVGAPSDPGLMSLFLDTGDVGLVRAGLEALRAARADEGFQVSRGMLSQLRLLAGDADDEIAEAAEELLEDLG